MFAKVDFTDQVVWITGAASGLGKAMALEFFQRGAKVVLSARRVERLKALKEELQSLTGQTREVAAKRILVAPVDVTSFTDLIKVVAKIKETFHRLDVLVANAGYGVKGRLLDIDETTWRKQLDTNVVGLAMSAKAALPELLLTKGRIALIGSVVSFVVSPYYGVYNASKYAVRAIGQVLAIELHGTGVSCTTIYPGLVATEFGQVNNAGHFVDSYIDKRPKFWMWTAKRAAKVMVQAIYKRKRDYIFTWHGRLAAFLGQHTPCLVDRLCKTFRVHKVFKSLM